MSQHTSGGIIAAIEPESFASEIGLQPGDEIIEVNGHPVEDVIDVHFYAADEWIDLKLRRNGMQLSCGGPRQYNQTLGVEFEHPTFDIDIRRCNNLCPFCFVLQMPNRMRRALYVKDDDYRYSFLHGHFVTLTNLTDRDWQRIADQFLSPLYVSVHATETRIRRACLRNPAAPDIMEQLRWLAEHDIEVHTQLVVTPGLNNGPYLGQSIRELATLWPHVQSVCVVPVGLTKHHKYDRRTLNKAEMRAIVDEVQGYQQEFLKQFGARFVYLTDEWYLQLGETVPPKSHYDDLALEENGQGMVRNFLDDWKLVKQEIRGKLTEGKRLRTRYKSATLVTGTLFGPTLTKAAHELSRLIHLPVDVAPIVNERLGETIVVAGLLMGADVIARLSQRELGDVLVLPRIMFDHPQGVALDDVSPLQIAQQLDRPVALADLMGDVLDAFTGRNRLLIKPSDEVIPLAVMKAGGWSIEKYL